MNHTLASWIQNFVYRTVQTARGQMTVYGENVVWRPLRQIFEAGKAAWQGPWRGETLNPYDAYRTFLALPLVEVRGLWNRQEGFPINVRGPLGEVGSYQISLENAYNLRHLYGDIYNLAFNPYANAQAAYYIYSHPGAGGFRNWSTYPLLRQNPSFYEPVDEWLAEEASGRDRYAGYDPAWVMAPQVNDPGYQSRWVAQPDGSWVLVR